MKTGKPLILTARIAQKDLAPFDRLRQAHFPPDRNFLRAHLTMFYRLPGEYEAHIIDRLIDASRNENALTADVSGIRHLGAGVAFVIESPALDALRATLKAQFIAWLGAQDMQGWRPHITVQNKVSKARADELFRTLDDSFQPHRISVAGLDLWAYLGGPWQHETYVPFGGAA